MFSSYLTNQGHLEHLCNSNNRRRSRLAHLLHCPILSDLFVTKMSCLPPFQAALFYSAAFAHVAIVPKHIYVGATAITEAIATIPNQPRYSVAKFILKTV